MSDTEITVADINRDDSIDSSQELEENQETAENKETDMLVNREKELKSKRKVIKGKITRAINRIKDSLKSKELTKRRSIRVIHDLKEDVKGALEIHAELYSFKDANTDRLNKWEEELTNEVYAIEEKIEDCFSQDRTVTVKETLHNTRSKKSSIEIDIEDDSSENKDDTSEDEDMHSATETVMKPTSERKRISKSKAKISYSKTESVKKRNSDKSEITSIDSWIDDLEEFTETKIEETELEEMSVATALLKIEARKEIPPMELTKFNGDPLDYVSFVECFKIHVHDKDTLTDNQRMGRLKMLLTGRAADSIKGLGASGIMYATALKSIKREFGQKSTVVRTMINKIVQGEVIRNNDRDSLRSFSIDIINCLATLKRLNRSSEATSPELLRKVIGKLPGYLIDRWKTEAMKIRDKDSTPDLGHISQFIQKHVRAQFDPDYGDLERNREPRPRGSLGNQMRKSVNSNQKSRECRICSKTDHHYASNCPTFARYNQEQRILAVRDKRLCYSCLVGGHRASECRYKKACGTNGCPRTHHQLLHVNPPSASGAKSVLDRESILPVIKARFRAPNGRYRTGNILIDSGAGTTIIRSDFARKLGLQGKREGLNITVVGGDHHQQTNSRRLQFWISPIDGVEEFQIEAHELNQTVNEVQPLDEKWITSFRHLRDIQLIQREGPIDLILGVQYSHLHAEQAVREGLPFEPIAKSTRLGWIIMGSEVKKSGIPTTATIACCLSTDTVRTQVQQLYDIETVGIQAPDCKCPKISPADKEVLELFEDSYRVEDKRCTVGLPWKKNPQELPSNYTYAEKRLESLERSLNRNPEKREKYRKVMREYIENGWAEEVTEKTNKNVYYLPHHGVVRTDKPSTPLRVVFDPASLNTYLHKGPSTLTDLFGILIRFREERIAIMGDVRKMFLQICLPERDTEYHRYLWRDMDASREPQIYRLLRVTFGDKPSPEMANFVMRKLAETHSDEYPEAADIMQKDRYMDDLIHSCRSKEEAEKRMEELNQILDSGSFQVKEWHFTNKESPDDKIDLTGEEDRVKTLGVSWCCEKDTIHFDVKSCAEPEYTKRSVLSKLSMLFDPLGLAAVVTIKAKIAMQEIWKFKELQWDDKLPEDQCKEWSSIFNDLEKLNGVKISRCLKPEDAVGEPELHVFADASISAYGACAYILWKTEREPSVKLVAAKSRVSPLRQITIPRLELMAALLAARLAKTLHTEMKIKSEVFLWTDSKVVLKWIQAESTTKKAFVAVRVAEIQSTWETNRWRYVPSKENVADDLSRGLRTDQLTARWFNGPEFLRQPKENWPIQDQEEIIEDDNIEERKPKKTCYAVQAETEIIDCQRYSRWRRLLRVTAYCFRFIEMLKTRVKKENKKVENSLQPEEIQRAEEYWIKHAQKEIPDWREKCKELSPFEQNGILRVGGRLRHSPLEYDERHPILLPPSSHITKMIVRDIHEKVYHTGAERTLTESRRKYWIIKGRNTVKGIVRSCVQCRKMRQPPHLTIMADLPPERLRTFSPPFTTTGVDLFGPFYMKYGRNKKIKALGAIFTCATVRAVHLEIVENLSTQAFLHALRRFASHHGWPKTILSDNGTSFVGAAKELKQREKKKLKIQPPNAV